MIAFGVSASVSHHNREFSLFIDYEYIFISIPFVSALTTIVTLCYNLSTSKAKDFRTKTKNFEMLGWFVDTLIA